MLISLLFCSPIPRTLFYTAIVFLLKLGEGGGGVRGERDSVMFYVHRNWFISDGVKVEGVCWVDDSVMFYLT